MNKVSIEKKDRHQDLLGLVFSWSLRDVLNKDLYINKVNQISDTFPSTANYLNSFKVPLLEETRAEFCSGLESVGQAPACEISTIWFSKDYRPPKDLYYEISTKMISGVDNHHGTHYEPESGDIFAITNVRPKNIGDLIKPDKPLHIAYVSKSYEDDPVIEILSSEKIDRTLLTKKHGKLYVTYLMNITTNTRIWRALHPDPKSKNLGLIQKVLQYNSLVDDECSVCLTEANVVKGRNMYDSIGLLGLDQSQKEAVLSSVSLRECSHKDYNVKLIWGPPGTGKTKTVASMLLILLKLNCCSTLTCAPTNVAVIQVAKRLVTLFLDSVKYETYGLGDIVLFGNEERMKIANHYELADVFLKDRVETIKNCLDRFTGWKSSLESMIALLEDPQARYNSYLVQNKGAIEAVDKDKEAQRNKSSDETVSGANVEKSRSNNTKIWKKVINQTLRENEKKNRKKGKGNGQGKHLEENDAKQSDDKGTKTENYMTFEEFLRKSFCSLASRLAFIAESFCTHLPTSCLPLNVAKQMIRLVDLHRMALEKARDPDHFSDFMMMKRKEFLAIMKMLHRRFPDPKIDGSIHNFCLENARLIFCTTSGAIKMRSRVDIVVIDEAAQLKECESAIPLQIPGVKTAILIGDDRQLPAMVHSKVLEKMKFGRSLFQRLARLGKNKHLLNIQYRMHPSISSFPNKEFYENKIVNAPIVQGKSYVKTYLKGDMYGSYSFINVSGGQENFKKGHSPRNLEEAAVVERIIAKLFKDYYCIAKKKVSVGLISPYKGQVGLLQEKIEKKYTKHKENFCINIRSVDGFQGGEEDIIIISTVRCNGNGSVGFLSNFQRTNVALTRARYCLWIVGSGSTLGNSGSVWRNLVVDAKTRGCFHNADDDRDLTHATSAGKPDFFGYLRLEKARWKVIFSNEFKVSISSIESVKVQKRVKEVLHSIADGRHQNTSGKSTCLPNDESIALELLEMYKVDEKLHLAWTVDIDKEESSYTQVIKVWDVLPASKIPNLAKNLNVLFGRYTVDFMNRCKLKCFDGNLVVPKSWPLHSFNGAPLALADPTEGQLSHQLAGLNIRGNRGESSTSVRNNGALVWKQVQRYLSSFPGVLTLFGQI